MEETKMRQRKTLMEKWKEHYQSRDSIFVPEPEEASKFGMAFFWLFSLSTAATMSCVLVPGVWYEPDGDHHYHLFGAGAIFMFMMTQIWMNWFIIAVLESRFIPIKVTADMSDRKMSNGAISAQNLAPGWKMCHICQVDAPPRSHHCKVCHTCVLKRDHHCYFTGSCIGFGNQRHFLVFLVYMTLLLAMFTVHVFWYINPRITLFSGQFYNYLPVVSLIQCVSGPVTVLDLLVLTQVYFCIPLLVVSFGFTGWMWFISCLGRTTWEMGHRVSVYSTGSVIKNLQITWGWLILIPLQFLIPVVCPFPVDGVHWKLYKSVKSH